MGGEPLPEGACVPASQEVLAHAHCSCTISPHALPLFPKLFQFPSVGYKSPYLEPGKDLRGQFEWEEIISLVLGLMRVRCLLYIQADRTAGGKFGIYKCVVSCPNLSYAWRRAGNPNRVRELCWWRYSCLRSVGGRLASTVMNDGNPATVSAMQEFSNNCLAWMTTHGVPTGAAMAPS